MARLIQRSGRESGRPAKQKPNASATSPLKSNLVHPQFRRQAVIEHQQNAPPDSASLAFEERHYPIAYWARRWGFSEKTVREWFRDEYGPGILCGSPTSDAGQSVTTPPL